ncbi:hypothetical protein ACJX0J_022119, partial [Zea mays]
QSKNQDVFWMEEGMEQSFGYFNKIWMFEHKIIMCSIQELQYFHTSSVIIHLFKAQDEGMLKGLINHNIRNGLKFSAWKKIIVASRLGFSLDLSWGMARVQAFGIIVNVHMFHVLLLDLKKLSSFRNDCCFGDKMIFDPTNVIYFLVCLLAFLLRLFLNEIGSTYDSY